MVVMDLTINPRPITDKDVIVTLGSDFVYGVSKISDAGNLSTGAEVTPMYKVEICDKKGEVIKTYQNDGLYILDTSFEDNMITVYQAEKEGNTYTATKEDCDFIGQVDLKEAYQKMREDNKC